MIDSCLTVLLSFILDRLELIIAPGRFFLGQLLVAFHVRIIATFVKNQFRAFFHSDLQCILAGSSNFLDAVMLSLEHLLRLNNLSTLVLQQEGLDRVVSVN